MIGDLYGRELKVGDKVNATFVVKQVAGDGKLVLECVRDGVNRTVHLEAQQVEKR